MKAAIIGGGVIGGGWVARFLLQGWDVVVVDPDPQAERKVGEVLTLAERSLPALYDRHLPQRGHLQFAESVQQAVTDADWIQESLPERLALKHAILAEIQQFCRKDALIGSSTSGFKPSDLQAESNNPKQIFVAHPFNPVYLLPLVELVGEQETTHRAASHLTHIGMKPLQVRKEIDAHIADRFLEAVWREALWLVKDDIATTAEIDDAIRYGFGLRWAQMGLFETYRVAGGEAGMAHFIAQFGPCLSWPWTKLMDVPALDDALVDKIAVQSDAQSGHLSIRALEAKRDDNLVAILRALKQRNWAAGAVLSDFDRQHAAPLPQDLSKPLLSLQRIVPVDWTDYNGHMNESRYGQVFSDASDTILTMLGAGPEAVDQGFSYFTVDNHIRFLQEAHAGDHIHVRTQILQGEGKKLRLYHQMYDANDQILSTSNQFLIHVDMASRRSSLPNEAVHARLKVLAEAQASLPRPEGL